MLNFFFFIIIFKVNITGFEMQMSFVLYMYFNIVLALRICDWWLIISMCIGAPADPSWLRAADAV